jgi:phosphatidate cytidylyltransferase
VLARAAARRPAPRPQPGRNDLTSRLAVGVGLVVLLVIAYALGPKALLVLAAAAVVACAAETYGILQRSGFRPATLLGLVATAGLMFAGYWRGVDALPLVVALTFAATMVWYLLGIVDARPLANVAVTAMAVLWVGFFGAFGSLLLRAGDGRGLFLGVVIVTIVSDIVAFLIGRQFGRHQLAPDVSPGKTVEGLVAGIVAALVVGAIVGKELSPWGGLKHGIALGILVAILAPIGDLFESLIKRDLNVKDSGTALGGHGGLLDRFDSLLLVLPGAYFLASYMGIVRIK